MVYPPFYVCGNHIIEGFSFVYDCTWLVQRKKQNMPMFTAYSALQTSLMNKSGYNKSFMTVIYNVWIVSGKRRVDSTDYKLRVISGGSCSYKTKEKDSSCSASEF